VEYEHPFYIDFSFFIVDGKWKVDVHIPLFSFHFDWKCELTVGTRTGYLHLFRCLETIRDFWWG